MKVIKFASFTEDEISKITEVGKIIKTVAEAKANGEVDTLDAKATQLIKAIINVATACETTTEESN